MSQAGYWKTKDGILMPITSMEDSHVKNSLRLLYKKSIESVGAKGWFDDKMIELGNEAQRRGLIPSGDMTIQQLIGHIIGWQVEWDRNKPAEIKPGKVSIAYTGKTSKPEAAIKKPTYEDEMGLNRKLSFDL